MKFHETFLSSRFKNSCFIGMHVSSHFKSVSNWYLTRLDMPRNVSLVAPNHSGSGLRLSHRMDTLMSNLVLPSLAFASLDAALPLGHGPLGAGRSVRIGYETRAYRFLDSICIQHHGTTIAMLSDGGNTVQITPAGWTSSTTTARLHTVMVDNGLWPEAFGVAIRQGQLMVITPDTMRKGLTPVPWYGVTFVRHLGGWLLTGEIAA